QEYKMHHSAVPASHRVLLRLLYFVILLGSFAPETVQAGSGCYYINGTERAKGDQYQPCDPKAKASMCCAIGPGRENKDTCLGSGLCLGNTKDASIIYWRETCTDPTWKDPA